MTRPGARGDRMMTMVRRGKSEFEPDEPDADPALVSLRAEEPDADTIDQHHSVFDEDGPEPDVRPIPTEVPEADAIDQRQDVPLRDEPGRP